MNATTAVVAVLFLAAAPATAAPLVLNQNLRNAEGWASQAPSAERDKVLKKWAEAATVDELVYVLRRDSRSLGSIEGLLAEKALSRTSPERAALRRRLTVRMATDPKSAKKRVPEMTAALADPPRAAATASVFRAGLLAPKVGGYASYSDDLRLGLEAGLARSDSNSVPIELWSWNTGDGNPPQAAAALDSAARTCGIVVGELLSETTLMIATGARLAGVPMISPIATDEAIGSVGTSVFAIGPASYERGRALAQAVGVSGVRVGALVSRDAPQGLVRGFLEAAKELGATVAYEGHYAAGQTSFRNEARDIEAKKVALLFWDGEPSEAEALLRQLGRDRLAVNICGGSALSPGQFHAEGRFLLEGVRYVADDWTLPPGEKSRLDAYVSARSERAAGALHVRGFLAGRMIAAAVRGGALCPEEITAQLGRMRKQHPLLGPRGFLDPGIPGIELPVFTVRRGLAVAGDAEGGSTP
jgi:ABC-type branched-subunit amino acid transport system substrate-binding protein